MTEARILLLKKMGSSEVSLPENAAIIEQLVLLPTMAGLHPLQPSKLAWLNL